MFPSKATLSLYFKCPNCLNDGHAKLNEKGQLDIKDFVITDTFENDGSLKTLRLICPQCKIGVEVMIPKEINFRKIEPWYFIHTQYDTLIDFKEFESTEKLALYLYEFAILNNISHFPVNDSIHDQVKHINRIISSSISISKAPING